MRIRLFILLLITTLCSLAQAQSASDGNDFYLGLLYPSYNTVSAYASNYSVVALVSSLEDNTISVSYFDPVSGVEEAPMTYKVTALNSVSIPLNIQKMKMTQSEVSEYRSVHIKGKKKISVQYFSTGASSGGAYLGLPANVLGRKYVVASYNDNPDGIGALVGGEAPSTCDIGCGEFIVIGTENGTNVTITMRSESEGGIKAGESRTVALNRGECYLVRSKCASNDADISGSLVESDRPVAVISGHSNASLGSVGDHVVEGRDFMIEQMIPAEYWDSSYYSFSFKTPTLPAINAVGETYRAYTFDTTISKVMMYQTFGSASNDISSSRFHFGEKIDVEGGCGFWSKSGVPFSVCQYDQTSHTELNPHPRPSMSQLIPGSRYRRKYHFSVPKKTFEYAQEDYIFITWPAYNLWVSKDGKGSTLESAGFKKYNLPQYYGTLYQVPPGSYVIGSYNQPFNDPFMVYQFGFRRMTKDARFGDYDGDDNFTSYAMPAGVMLPTVDAVDLSLTIDTLCNGWNICVTDAGIEGGLMSAELINDPNGVLFPRTKGQHGYEYFNIGFDSAGILLKSPKLSFDGEKSTVCFTLKRKNSNVDAFAPILITNNKGRTLLLDLNYSSYVSYTYADGRSFTGSDFGSKGVGYIKDTIINIVNDGNSTVDHIVTAVALKQNTPSFEITNISSRLPARLKPSQSLSVTLRMRCLDTGTSTSSLVFVDECSSTEYQVSIRGVTGILSVSDFAFDDTKVSRKVAGQKIQVRNIGTAKCKLTESVSISDTINYIVDLNTLKYNGTYAQLPLELIPGSYATIDVDFYPKSYGYKHCEIRWTTDISSKYALAGKTTSTISGNALRYGVYWDKDELRFRSDDNGLQRIDLVNAYDSITRVSAVRISGLDAAEFKISNSESTLENFRLTANDRDWYSIEFIPNMERSLPDRYTMRSANLEAIVADTTVSIPLYGDVSKLKVMSGSVSESFALEHQLNSSNKEEIICKVNSPLHLSYSVYSILGQEVVSFPRSYFGAGRQVLQLPISKLTEGSYLLRVSDGVLTKSIGFRVVK